MMSTSSTTLEAAVSNPCPYDPGLRLKLKSLLHTRSFYTRFAPSHILSKAAPNLRQHKISVLQDILSVNVGVSSKTFLEWKRLKMVLESRFLPEIGNLIDKHKKFDYNGCLKSAILKHKGGSTTDHLPQKVVFHFVCEVLRNVLPEHFVGHNTRGLQKLGRAIVQGRPPLTLKHLFNCINGDLKKGWMRHVPNNILREHMAAKISLWVASEFVPAAVRAVVYGTRMVSGKSEPIFFTKPIWQSKSRLALNNLVESGYLKRLPKDEFVDGKVKPGVLRFLPKPTTGLRPIVVKPIVDEATDRQMKKAKLLMKSINPKTINLEREWSKFCLAVKGVRATGDKGRVIFVRTDVRNAFVTLRHKKLLEVLDRHMSSLPPQVQVEEGPVTPWLIRKLTRSNSTTSSSVGTSQGSFGSQTSSEGTSQRSSQNILPRKVAVSRDATCKTLKREIQHQVLRYGNKQFKMEVGLAQGGPLSNNLCNMAFEDLCKEHLSEFTSEDGLTVLWRVADDFLLLTLLEAAANRFLEVIGNGFPIYGWRMSSQKSETNILKLETTQVKFSGAVFDFETLEVMADLSAHSAQSVVHSFSFRHPFTSVRDYFEKMMLMTGALKITQLYLNASFLSRQRILQQISACGKLQALRIRALTLYLFGSQCDKEDGHEMAGLILLSARKVTARILKVLRATSKSEGPELPTSLEIRWLLNMAVYKRSCGFLIKSRGILKSHLLKLESQIPHSKMSECYKAHLTNRPWDSKM